MKLSFSTLGCPDWRFDEIMATAKDFGFDGVEVRGVRSKTYAPDIKAFGEFWPENSEKIAKLGIGVVALSSGICVREYGKPQIDEAVAYAKLADKIGAKYIRILGDTTIAPQNSVDDDVVIKALKEIASATADTNAVFLVESNGAFADSKRLAKVIEAVDSEKVQALWDVHHPYRYFNETPAETWENIGKYVKFVHIKDSIIENGAVKYKMMGRGDIPMDDIIAVLKTGGYDGFLSLEWVKRWCHELEEPGIVFVQYINYMKKKLR